MSPEQLAAKKQAEQIRLAQRQRERGENCKPFMTVFPMQTISFFIAGYTSGGAPYGVTWEEMGLEPWEPLEDL